MVSTDLRNAGPEPKRFSVADGWLLEVASAAVAPILRGGSGALCWGYEVNPSAEDVNPSANTYSVVRYSGKKVAETSKIATLKRPALPLELYEFESCPYCAKVREAVSILDLDVVMRPCPKEGTLWRPQAIEKGGKKQFPYLVDPNTGTSMYESDAIVKYLFKAYGPGEDQVPTMLSLGQLTNITAALGQSLRAQKGHQARASKQAAQPLVLWGYQASPFVKVVREVLCELELPYLYRNAARGSPKRQELLDKRGHFQVPYLEDPNAGVYLFESSAIVDYLNKTYAA